MSKMLSFEPINDEWQIVIAESTWDHFNFMKLAGQRDNGREPVDSIITWCDEIIGKDAWRHGADEGSYDGHSHWIIKFIFKHEASAHWFLLTWGEFIQQNDNDRLDFWTD